MMLEPVILHTPPAHPGGPDTQELLELLDDVVYGAIDCRPDSLVELSALWPGLVAKLGPEQLDESREQYLRFALSIWDDYVINPQCALRAAAALDVLCLLFE